MILGVKEELFIETPLNINTWETCQSKYILPNHIQVSLAIFLDLQFPNYKDAMAFNPVVLILGAGPRIGASVAEKFSSNGYKVAIASRSGTETKTAEGYLSLKADFNTHDSIPALFDVVKAEFHAAPSVVIYNAAALTPPPDKANMFSIPGESVHSDLCVNTISPYVAAQQCVSAWETMSKETKKTFIFTGNVLNVSILPVPMMVNLGMGKSVSAYWLGVADSLYSAREIR